jgi:uncharacterized membrane protein YagU involved in acid resistance
LPCTPFSYIFHSGLEENICALAILLSISPASTVYIFICVSHNSFSISQAITPVTVVFSYSEISLFSNAWLGIILPLTFIAIWCLSILKILSCICICTISMSQL